MAQIMNTKTGNAGSFADCCPRAFDLYDMAALAVAGKYISAGRLLLGDPGQ
jgi:hypothetical protein